MIFRPLIIQLLIILLLVVLTMLSGCASIPLANYGQDALLKTFPKPAKDQSGLYVFRDTRDSARLKKRITLDGEILGDSAMYIYFYKTIEPGEHTLATQSEFGDNAITFEAVAGENIYVRQRMKLGVFLSGAELEVVDEKQGQRGVLKCYLAQDYMPQPDIIPLKLFSAD